MDINNLLQLLSDNKYDYDFIFNHQNTIKILSDDDRYINVFISIKGRSELLKPVIKYMMASIENSNLKIKITVIECDVLPICMDICEEMNCDYIFIDINQANTGNECPKALMYNCGFLFTKKAEYNLFHDSDILVSLDFFKIIEDYYLNDKTTFLQPFTQKRLKLLSPDYTKKFINDDNYINLSDIKESDYKIANSGAPGGSILVKKNIFNAIGGFDPELFYGYSCEDSFFWTKLECLFSIIDEINYCHVGNGVYADNPPIELYHLYHVQAHLHDKFDLMENYIKSFWNMKYEDKLLYIEKKCENFNYIK